MKHETKDTVKKSLIEIDEGLDHAVGSHKLHEHEKMTDDEFKDLVHTLTKDIIEEFETVKKRVYDEGFAEGAKATDGGKTPLIITHAPDTSAVEHFDEDIRRAEKSLSEKMDQLYAEQARKHAAFEQADDSLHRQIRELRDELEKVGDSAAPDKAAEKLVAQAKERLEDMTQAQEALAEKVGRASDMEKKIDTLSERVEKLAREADPERVMNLVIDNGTKVNALGRRLTNLSKRLRRNARRTEEVYKGSARKVLAKRLSQHRNRIEEVYSLSARKPRPSKKKG
ncbi:MAG: hypothetical protein V1787_01325 [Candidatus Micrarchaeota archaeon]